MSRWLFVLGGVLLLALIGLGVFLLVAPSGGNGSVSEQEASDAVQHGLLVLDDFPSGWSSAPPDEDEGQNLQLMGECAILNVDEFPGQIADAESGSFTGPEEQVVSSGAAAFADEDKAATAMDTFTRATQTCRKQLRAEFDRLFREGFGGSAGGGAELTDFELTLEDLSLPVDADDSAAYRVKFAGNVGFVSFEGTADYLVARQGHVVGGFSYYVFGHINADEEQRFADLVVERLGEADKTLD